MTCGANITFVLYSAACAAGGKIDPGGAAGVDNTAGGGAASALLTDIPIPNHRFTPDR